MKFSAWLFVLVLLVNLEFSVSAVYFSLVEIHRLV